MLEIGAKDEWLANKRILANHLTYQEEHREYISTNYADYMDYLKDGVYTFHQGVEEVPHAFVYCIYGDRCYLEYARYSIMSLRLAMSRAKIYIYVEEDLYWDAWLQLKPFVLEDDIICLHGKTTCYKHVVACDRALQKYTAVTFIDADLFFIIKDPTKCDILWQLDRVFLETFSMEPKQMMWAFGRKEHPNVAHTFMHKRGREATRYKDKYIWDLEEILDINVQKLIQKENIWNISYIFTFCPKALITPEYQAFVQNSQFTWNHCDESHWWLWGKKEKFLNTYWNFIFEHYLTISSETEKSDKNVHLFQPMFTDTLHTKTHRKEETLAAILNIEKQYKEHIDNKNYRVKALHPQWY